MIVYSQHFNHQRAPAPKKPVPAKTRKTSRPPIMLTEAERIERDALLRRLWTETDMNGDELAERLGYAQCASVYARARFLGLPPRKVRR